jgi:hypothetical protein
MGRLFRCDEAGKRPPEPVGRGVDEQSGRASRALAPSGRRQRERQRPDKKRRDVGGEDVALPQSRTHEPEIACSKVAKPTVDQARGGP